MFQVPGRLRQEDCLNPGIQDYLGNIVTACLRKQKKWLHYTYIPPP
jgi:hypothetical protein